MKKWDDVSTSVRLLKHTYMPKLTTPFFHILSCVVNENNVNWSQFNHFTPRDWEFFYALSKRQGVVANIFDAIKATPKEFALPKHITMRWISHALSIEDQMKKKERVAIEFAEELSKRDIQTIVLKGLAYASYYPNPYHRESGDLDCYLLGQKELGDKVTIEIGGKMEEAGYKHSHLYYKGLTIENHNFLTSFDNTKLGIRTERLLQELISQGCRLIGDTKLQNPSADFNALFLIKHAQRHFIKEGISIRHLLDWTFFLKAESQNVNWEKVIHVMQECRILEFAKVMTRLCIEQLGMKIDIAELSSPMKISDAVLADILGGQPDLFHENFMQKIGLIIRRFYRMWKFRSLADESYCRLVWNSLAFSSYLKRNPKL